MNPIDGLRPSNKKQDKIYRSNSRVNFLVDQKKAPIKPMADF